MEPLFSIIILTKNSIGVIERLVDALLSQEFEYSYEVIFMDNNSTDKTVEYLKKTEFKQKKIIPVPEKEFSHSRTRMKAAEMAKGKYIVFFTDDIIPIGKYFLNYLTDPVLNNKSSATYGVFQINEKTSDPIDAYIHNSWYKNADDITPPISTFYWNKFSPEMRRTFCNFDNCSSCIDRNVLMKLQLPDVPYGEDMMFAKQLLLNGHSVALSKKAKFYHWHHVSFTYLMKRMCIDQYLSIKEYGVYYVRRKIGVVKAILIRVFHRSFIAFFNLKIPFRKKIYWSFYNMKTLTADFIGKYIGILNEDSVRNSRSLLNRWLLKLRNKIIDDIFKNSILRY